MTQSIGPPSLAQGTRIAVGFSTSISRFIPACGELLAAPIFVRACAGSSPLARGTLYRQTAQPLGGRFIPAYAGNSMIRDAADIAPSVHPRLRGELNLQLRGLFDTLGSSPLTRGTHKEALQKLEVGRFIPAYAGNSEVRNVKVLAQAVHPRLRGELSRKRVPNVKGSGSSPLTRGTL